MAPPRKDKDHPLDPEDQSNPAPTSSKRRKKKYPKPMSYQHFFEEYNHVDTANTSRRPVAMPDQEVDSAPGMNPILDHPKSPPDDLNGQDNDGDQVGDSGSNHVQERHIGGEDMPNSSYMKSAASRFGAVGGPDSTVELPMKRSSLESHTSPTDGTEDHETHTQALPMMSISPCSEKTIVSDKEFIRSNVYPEPRAIDLYEPWPIIQWSSNMTDPDMSNAAPERISSASAPVPASTQAHYPEFARLSQSAHPAYTLAAMLALPHTLGLTMTSRQGEPAHLPPMLAQELSLPPVSASVWPPSRAEPAYITPIRAPMLAHPPLFGLTEPPQRADLAPSVRTPTRVPCGVYSERAFANLGHGDTWTGMSADRDPPENLRPAPQNLRYGGYQTPQAPQSRAPPLGSGRLQNASKSGAFHAFEDWT